MLSFSGFSIFSKIFFFSRPGILILCFMFAQGFCAELTRGIPGEET